MGNILYSIFYIEMYAYPNWNIFFFPLFSLPFSGKKMQKKKNGREMEESWKTEEFRLNKVVRSEALSVPQ